MQVTLEDKAKLQIVADNINRFLTERGISGRELARRANVSNATVSRLINALHDPGFITLDKLAEVLGTTIDYLLRDHQQKKSGDAA